MVLFQETTVHPAVVTSFPIETISILKLTTDLINYTLAVLTEQPALAHEKESTPLH